MFRSKFTKFLSFLKQQISFSSKFASIFSVMRHKSSILFYVKVCILSTKGAYQSTHLVKFHVSSAKPDILHFDGFFLPKSYKVSAKKSTEELYLVTLKSDSKFKEKRTCGFKYDMKNLMNFNASSGKSENLSFDVLLLSKAYYI